MADTKSKLETVRSSRTVSTSITTEQKENKEPPKGAKILSKTVRVETDKIENGWLISKNFDIKYEYKGQTNWAYYSKKWYSKTDPLDVKLNDASLADEFDPEEE